MRRLAILHRFNVGYWGVWNFQVCGMAQTNVRPRDADGMCRWGMFDLSSIDSFNVTISTSLGGVSGGWPKNQYDQGGPDVGDRFCQKPNQKLSEFLDMFRQMCVVKGIQKCLGSETVRGGWRYQLVSYILPAQNLGFYLIDFLLHWMPRGSKIGLGAPDSKASRFANHVRLLAEVESWVSLWHVEEREKKKRELVSQESASYILENWGKFYTWSFDVWLDTNPNLESTLGLLAPSFTSQFRRAQVCLRTGVDWMNGGLLQGGWLASTL